MELSRRRALLSAGAVAVGGLAGCVERRVTERRSRVDHSTNWALSPALGVDRDEDAFESYVEAMGDRYGDSGVWGTESEPGGEFVAAFTHQFAPQTPRADDEAAPRLEPEPVDSDAVSFVHDAAVAVYRQEDDRYRYWLWSAANTDQRPGLELGLVGLSTGISFPGGELSDGSDVTAGDGDASVALPGGPAGRFPLESGSVEATTSIEDRRYLIAWSGGHEGVQSINGVCEERRDGEYDFRWNVSVGVEFVEEE